MTQEESFERFHRKRRELVAEMRRIRDDTDAILERLEQHAPVALPDVARLEGLRAQRVAAFEGYQAAEDELINALLATLKSQRESSA
jgi:hypothetical protein